MKWCYLFAVISTLFLSSCFKGGNSEENEPTDDSSQTEESSVGSESTASGASSREEINELRKEKKTLEGELKDIEESISKSDDIIVEEIEVAKQLEEVRAYARAVSSFEAELDQSLTDWQAATWKSFVGVKLPQVTTIDGRNFREVEITSVAAETLGFSHSGGSESVEVIQLPLSLRRNLIHTQTVLAERD